MSHRTRGELFEVVLLAHGLLLSGVQVWRELLQKLQQRSLGTISQLSQCQAERWSSDGLQVSP